MIYTCITDAYDPPRSDSVHVITPRMASKAPKILSHLFSKGTSVWLDGNITLNVPEDVLVSEWLEGADIATFAHPYRQTVDEEATECVLIKAETQERIDQFFSIYREVKQMPLYETGVLVRGSHANIVSLNELWWLLYRQFSVRDQLTFPLALSMSLAVKIKCIQGNVRNHPWFTIVPHTHQQIQMA